MKPIQTSLVFRALLPLVALLAFAPGLATAQVGNISPTEHNSWGENVGWVDFRPSFGGVTVSPTFLSGYAWAENAGWVNLGSGAGPYANTTPANYGVNRNISGNLTGYAWSENAGWIRFDPLCGATPCGGVTLDGGTLQFAGYAWAENAGWIHFRGQTTEAVPTPYGVASSALPVELQLFTIE